MNIDYKVGEVKLSYKPKFKNQQKVTCSEDAYRYMLSTYKMNYMLQGILQSPVPESRQPNFRIYSNFRGRNHRNLC